jgi:hypothetical protein
MLALATVSAAIITACATTVQEEIANVPPTSVETPSYYPFQVKEYQNSYPRRRVLVLMPLESRDFKDAGGQTHEPVNGNPAIGVILRALNTRAELRLKQEQTELAEADFCEAIALAQKMQAKTWDVDGGVQKSL